MIAAVNSFNVLLTDNLQARFLVLLPRIETHARIYFRHIPCPDKRADRIAETVALSWKWFVRLAQRGRDAADFVSTLASLAAQAVKSGRGVCGQKPARDVMNTVAQQRHGFAVESLLQHSTLSGNDWDEALHDNTRTPPDQQAAFRIDFPEWLGTWSERDRRIIENMVLGEQTRNLSRKFGVSPARISQLRREYHQDWLRFHGEPIAANSPSFRPMA